LSFFQFNLLLEFVKQTNKPILHLICGLPGAGKTTLAKEIAASSGAIRFCPDEWIKSIWDEKAEITGNQFRDNIEQLQWKTVREILRNSVDVIIEWGTWGRDEREKLRDEAKELGAQVKFYYLDVSREILKERILARNKATGEFYILENEIEKFLDDCFNSIQIPTVEELNSYDFLG
jgi:predicted kinase